MTEKTFRLNGKHLFLTYSQCDLSREEALSQLKEKFEKGKNKVLKYVIGTEKHKVKGQHIHAYLELKWACDIRDARRLDLKKGNTEFKGNLQTCRSYSKVQRYITKEGLENVLSNVKLTEEGKFETEWDQALRMAEENGDVEGGLNLLRNVNPKFFLVNKARMEQTLKEQAGKKKQALEIRPMSAFNYPKPLLETLSNLSSHTIHITGPSGVGKTQAVLALLYGLFGEELLYLRGIEKLRDFDKIKHAIILFDDVDIRKLTREERLALLDRETPAEVRVLYKSVEIPASIMRVFISNESAEKQFGGEKAIMRRVKEVDLSGYDLIKEKVEIKRTLTLHWDGKKSVEELTQIWSKQLENNRGKALKGEIGKKDSGMKETISKPLESF